MRSTLSDGSGNIEVDTADANIPTTQKGQFADMPNDVVKSAIRPAIILCLDGAPDGFIECDEGGFDF